MMCSCDGEQPTVYLQKMLVARKAHTCCECCEPISRGVLHEWVKGLWEAEWETFRTCPTCLGLRKRLEEATGCHCHTFTNLLEEAYQEGLWSPPTEQQEEDQQQWAREQAEFLAHPAFVF